MDFYSYFIEKLGVPFLVITAPALGFLYFLLKQSLPKIIESWFGKEKELRDYFLKEKVIEERRIYKDLWFKIHTYMSKSCSVDDCFELTAMLCKFRDENLPFIHPLVSNEINSIINCLDSDNGENNVQANVSGCVYKLGNVLSERMYRYDR